MLLFVVTMLLAVVKAVMPVEGRKQCGFSRLKGAGNAVG
jgi:hypothetical protein